MLTLIFVSLRTLTIMARLRLHICEDIRAGEVEKRTGEPADATLFVSSCLVPFLSIHSRTSSCRFIRHPPTGAADPSLNLVPMPRPLVKEPALDVQVPGGRRSRHIGRGTTLTSVSPDPPSLLQRWSTIRQPVGHSKTLTTYSELGRRLSRRCSTVREEGWGSVMLLEGDVLGLRRLWGKV